MSSQVHMTVAHVLRFPYNDQLQVAFCDGATYYGTIREAITIEKKDEGRELVVWFRNLYSYDEISGLSVEQLSIPSYGPNAVVNFGRLEHLLVVEDNPSCLKLQSIVDEAMTLTFVMAGHEAFIETRTLQHAVAV